MSNMAIKYSMMKQGRKMADGGMCMAHGSQDCAMCHGGKMAEGGEVGAEEEDERMLNQHGEDEVGPEGMMDDNEQQHERMVEHPVENQDYIEDMVGRIMRQREQQYSEGGQVSNDTPPLADFEDNQFDDLVKDDRLESSYTGANSGDELGNAQEDEDRDDIVARIMRSRRLKDRMPVPA